MCSEIKGTYVLFNLYRGLLSHTKLSQSLKLVQELKMFVLNVNFTPFIYDTCPESKYH